VCVMNETACGEPLVMMRGWIASTLQLVYHISVLFKIKWWPLSCTRIGARGEGAGGGGGGSGFRQGLDEAGAGGYGGMFSLIDFI